jgi:tripartite-type tricarboxylate transporter receptor subunit TctC
MIRGPPPDGSVPLQREGEVRLLALTGETRSRLTPELPTLVESGYAGAVSGIGRPKVVPVLSSILG